MTQHSTGREGVRIFVSKDIAVRWKTLCQTLIARFVVCRCLGGDERSQRQCSDVKVSGTALRCQWGDEPLTEDTTLQQSRRCEEEMGHDLH